MVKGASHLSHEQELILFRVIQEMLSNTLKHSRAPEAVLMVVCAKHETLIKYGDNGDGFDPETIDRGAGLNNMEERCKLIQAEFLLSSESGKGTQITIKLSH